jgi:hypothetical protein
MKVTKEFEGQNLSIYENVSGQIIVKDLTYIPIDSLEDLFGLFALMVIFLNLLSGTTKRAVREERQLNLEQKPHGFQLKRIRGEESRLLEPTFLSNPIYRLGCLGKDCKKSN